MQSYQLDLLDEKALVILRGLEQLRIIALKPLAKETEPTTDGESEDKSTSIVDGPDPEDKLRNFKKLQGSINLNMTREEIDIEIDKTREGWR